MLITSKILSSIMGSLTIIFIMNKLLKIDNEENIIKLIVLSILFSAVSYYAAGIEYNTERTLLKLTLYIMLYKTIFKYSTYKILITLLLTIAILSLGDLIVSLVFINFITAQQVRGVWYWILICNISVYIITLTTFQIPVLRKKLISFVNNRNEHSKISSILIMVLSVFIILYLIYNISVNYHWNEKYFINILIAITYIVIISIFLKDKIEYQNLMNQYDILFEYFKEFENAIDNITLVNHEYKNQLAVLKGYIENNKKKDALKCINDISVDINEEDRLIVSELKNLPKGGIKGLIYYKIITAKNNKISITLDISKNVSKPFEKLTYEENKTLSKILGVYIDNAIDAVSQTKEKLLTIEIYVINNNINIVISNPFNKNNVDIKSISKKGYTTKGPGHGKGLYLVNRLINNFKNFTTETKIIKGYYVQRLVINKK